MERWPDQVAMERWPDQAAMERWPDQAAIERWPDQAAMERWPDYNKYDRSRGGMITQVNGVAAIEVQCSICTQNSSGLIT